MRARLFVAAAVVAVGLAGCAPESAPARDQPDDTTSTTASTTTPTRESEPPPTATPSAPTSPSRPGGDVPVGAARVPAGQVDAAELPSYYAHRGEVWVFDHDRSLRMFAMASSGCTDAEAVVSDQSASEVRITLRALPQPPGNRPGGPDGGVCTQVLTPRPVTVTLAEPLGDRTIHLSAGR
jgi:hypothetical protein